MVGSDQAMHSFYDYFGRQGDEVEVYMAPGRVNLFGDYLAENNGSTLSISVNMGITAVVRWRQDTQVNMRSDRYTPPCSMSFASSINYDFKLGWANVPRGIMRYLEENGIELSGADMYFASDVPESAGMGASAATKMVTAYMFTSHRRAAGAINRLQLIKIAEQADREFLGVESNVLNLMVSCLGKSNHALMADAHTTDYRLIPINLDQYQLVVINTKKAIDNIDQRVRERMQECREILDLVRRRRPAENLSEISIEDVELISDEYLKRRALYIVGEQSRVFDATKKVLTNDIAGLGGLMFESHRSLRDEFEASGPELDAVVEEARMLPGCVGARPIGWGFAGCALALVKKENYGNFRSQLEVAYKGRVGYKPDFHPTTLADGVKRVI
ncbi:MAG: hypothetical protein N3A57_06515 [Negativicutes bacterium]|nr:hypothetical protein [Negativicutes bacterium]